MLAKHRIICTFGDIFSEVSVIQTFYTKCENASSKWSIASLAPHLLQIWWGSGLKKSGDRIFDRNVVNVRMVIPLNRHQNHIKAERWTGESRSKIVVSDKCMVHMIRRTWAVRVVRRKFGSLSRNWNGCRKLDAKFTNDVCCTFSPNLARVGLKGAEIHFQFLKFWFYHNCFYKETRGYKQLI